MLAYRLIERKRDGGRIEPGEWRALCRAYASGHVPGAVGGDKSAKLQFPLSSERVVVAFAAPTG